MQAQLDQLSQRREELHTALESGGGSQVEGQKEELDALLDKRGSVEKELSEARRQVEELDVK